MTGTRGERNKLQYNDYLREDIFFSSRPSINPFYRVDLFGDTEEDVCVHGTPADLPDEPSGDVLVYIRRGTPISEIVDGLLAIGIRAEEGLE